MDTVDDTAPEARKIGGWLLVFLILVALRSAAGLFVGAQEVGPMLSSGEYGIAEIIASSLAGLACY